MSNNYLTEIKDISEIKKIGFYRLGNSIVKADSIGLPDFEGFVMPPITICKPNGNLVQLFLDKNGKGWCRACVDGNYQNWIDLEEVNLALSIVKAASKDTTHE